jgi:hypothetical protein
VYPVPPPILPITGVATLAISMVGVGLVIAGVILVRASMLRKHRAK